METITSSNTDTKTIFTSQRRTALRLKKSGFEERSARLNKLKEEVINHTEAITQALYDDFKKPLVDAQQEIAGIVGEVDFANAFLESWMKPEIVTTPDIVNAWAGLQKIKNDFFSNK